MSGWDGDALAGQMEDAAERAEQAAEERKRRLDHKPVDKARTERLESMRLSQARVTEQLTRATNPAHRAMLEKALASIEGEMNLL
jgi:hypothetical protein